MNPFWAENEAAWRDIDIQDQINHEDAAERFLSAVRPAPDYTALEEWLGEQGDGDTVREQHSDDAEQKAWHQGHRRGLLTVLEWIAWETAGRPGRGTP